MLRPVSLNNLKITSLPLDFSSVGEIELRVLSLLGKYYLDKLSLRHFILKTPLECMCFLLKTNKMLHNFDFI